MRNNQQKNLVYVITPVLNEEGNISRLIEGWKAITSQLQYYDFVFILVDDGSTDATVNEVQRLKNNVHVELLQHSQNMGPGKAFATGFAFLKEKLTENDIVVTMEGDNTSRIETLEIMIGRIEREKVDVVLASPYAYGGGVFNTVWYRVFLSHIANGLIKAILGIHGIHTMSSFFRAYKANVILRLQKEFGDSIISSNGFECMIELLQKIIHLNCTISEVAMSLDTSQRVGKSKMKIIRTIRGYIRLMVNNKINKHEQFA